MDNAFELFLVFLFVIGSVSLVHGQEPPTTECTQDGGPACQEPFFTDNLNQYFFGLRGAEVFSSTGDPGISSPTLLHGTEAGNLVNRESSTASGTKTEYFIQGGGAAGTDSFGRGSTGSENVAVPGNAYPGTDSLGGFIVNPPHNQDGGMCGDGIPNVGDSLTCPQDHYLPENVTGVSSYRPSYDVFFDERPDTTSIDLGVAEYPGFSHDPIGMGGTDLYLESNPSIGPFDYSEWQLVCETGGSECGYTVVSSVDHLMYRDIGENNLARAAVNPQPEDDDDFFTEADDTSNNELLDAREICTDAVETDLYASQPQFTTSTETFTRGASYYDAGKNHDPDNPPHEPGGWNVEVEYNSGIDSFNSPSPITVCSDTTTVWEKCEGGPEACDDPSGVEDYYPDLYLSNTVSASFTVVEREVDIERKRYGIEQVGSFTSHIQYPEVRNIRFDNRFDTSLIGGLPLPNDVEVLEGASAGDEFSGGRIVLSNPGGNTEDVDHLAREGRIFSHSVSSLGSDELGSGQHYYLEPDFQPETMESVVDPSNTETITSYTGENATDLSRELCGSYSGTGFSPDTPNIDTSTSYLGGEFSYYLPDFESDERNVETENIDVSVTHGTGGSVNKLTTCSNTFEVNTRCDGGGCDTEERTYYPTSSATAQSWIGSYEWSVALEERFSLNQNGPLWDVRDDIDFTDVLSEDFEGGISNEAGNGYHERVIELFTHYGQGIYDYSRLSIQKIVHSVHAAQN